ncbi:YjcZ family sporulation protein [Ureibacillus sp. NPDC094379]
MGYGNVGGAYCGSGGNVGGAYDRYDRCNNSKEFVLLVVLFILLIIVGTAFLKDRY